MKRSDRHTHIHRPIQVKHKDMLLLLSVLLLSSVFRFMLLPCFITTSTLPALLQQSVLPG